MAGKRWRQLTSFFLKCKEQLSEARFTLRKKCPYSNFLWSLFSRIWTDYGEILRISPHSVEMRENTDQKNPFHSFHFSRSVNLHKFESNSADFEILVNGQTNDRHKTKILGLQWDKLNDTFIFDMKDLKKLIIMKLTKREFIQLFASIYDPSGPISSFVVSFEGLFQ